MNKAKNYNKFESLKIWQQAHQLVLFVYKITKSFPSEERYGLQSQIKRAAVSVASNIVEGNERQSKKEYIQFCFISRASLAEVRYQATLSKDLEYISPKDNQLIQDQCFKVSKLLSGLIKYLKS